MWCLEVIKEMNKPKPKEEEKKDQQSKSEKEDPKK